MSTLGILGGGQLARMLVLAGAPLGIRFAVFDPVADACAGQVAPLQVGAFDDVATLAAFAEQVDVITFDFENVPATSAQQLAAQVPVFPSPAALAVAQDRLSEKPCSASSAFRCRSLPRSTTAPAWMQRSHGSARPAC